MGDVCGIFSWHEVCPMEIKVVLLSIDEGAEEVEIISGSMHADEDNAVLDTQGEDGGGGKAIATEIGVLVHLLVVGAVAFLAVEGVYE